MELWRARVATIPCSEFCTPTVNRYKCQIQNGTGDRDSKQKRLFNAQPYF
ncbi:hypothetical protein HMPREF9554_02363 [Treponema phagedenis F0421]|nr:hypothetical protein HMPREF9554_02363 [Treponema phagedenis F0421]